MTNKNILLAVLAGVLTMGAALPEAKVEACLPGLALGAGS
jgi:hypothetical protein